MRMEVPKEAEAAVQIQVRRVLLGLVVLLAEVAAGRRLMQVLDMFLAVLRGLFLVLVHLINLKVVWTLIMLRPRYISKSIISVVIFYKRLLPFPTTEFC